MKRLDITGVVINDDDKWFYDWTEQSAVSPKDVKDFLAKTDGKEAIQVAINSQGGSVFAGSEIYTLLKSYQGSVEVVVTGLAASIASIIMMAGDTIKMSPIAQVMIHNASMRAQGDYRDLAHASEIIEVRELMDKETHFTAQRALEIGLVDEILFTESSPDLAASFGGIVPHAKLVELKANMEQDNQLNLLLTRFDRMEMQLNELQKSQKEQKQQTEKPVVHDVLADYLF